MASIREMLSGIQKTRAMGADSFRSTVTLEAGMKMLRLVLVLTLLAALPVWAGESPRWNVGGLGRMQSPVE